MKRNEVITWISKSRFSKISFEAIIQRLCISAVTLEHHGRQVDNAKYCEQSTRAALTRPLDLDFNMLYKAHSILQVDP